MHIARIILPTAAILTLTACGGAEEKADTSYEESLSVPTPQGDTDAEPVDTNDSITGGPDEQVDAESGGDNIPVVEDPAG
ncbi:MAG: hypothetical protein WA948_06985 [Pontixanthobacter sp.]